MRLGLFDVSMRLVKLTFVQKQRRQAVMNPKRHIVAVENGGDCEGCLEMVNGLLSLALGMVDFTKEAVGFTDLEFLTFLREEVEGMIGGFIRSVQLFVVVKQPSKEV